MFRDHRPSRPSRAAGIILGTLLALLLQGRVLAAEIRFDIPSQPAPDALTAFATQAGVSLLFPFGEFSRVTTNALVGTYTIDEGLSILLAGTGLSASVERRTQVVIRTVPDATNPALPRSRRAGGDGNGPDDRALGEVVVTARRREESLQDVPISIAAISAGDIELRNTQNIADLNAFLPNVSIRGGGTSGGSEGQFVIRGIPGVARYVDGVVQQANEGSLINVVELERIEVLRGPQGTLFGKNAIGGAIQYITQKPRGEFSARMRATAGSFNRRDIVASVDIPATDSAFLKLTAARLARDGHVEGELSGVRYGEQDNRILRGQLLWRPGTGFEALLSVDLSDIDERQQANVLYDVIEEQNLVRQYNQLGFTFTDDTHALGGDRQYRNRSLHTGTGNLWHSLGMSLNLSWQVSDTLALRSISGVRSYDWGNYQDLDASEYAFFEQWFYREGRESSQEFQLQGTGARFDWTVGAYYASEERQGLALRWQYEEVAPRPRNDVTVTDTVDTALFGEGTWRIDRRWAMTLGLRYTRERYENAVFTTALPRPAWQETPADLRRGAPIGDGKSARFDSLTPRFTLQYDLDNDVMAYVSYAEGFNGGGINSGAPINDEVVEYDSEVLAQYELGVKSTVHGGRLRLNANYFEAYWDDIQINEVIVPGQLTIRNAGAARIRGIEVDTIWRASDGLVLGLSAAWLDTQYTRLEGIATVRLDTDFALAPARSLAASATYEWRLGGGGTLRLRGDYGWLDEHVTIDDFRLQKPQDAYGLLNGRLVYTAPGDRWDIAVFGTNLSDEWYQLGGFSATLGGVDQGVVSRPREFGVTFGIRL